MIVQSLRHAGWPVLLACASAVACSKTPAAEDVFVSASLTGINCPVSNANVLTAGGANPGGQQPMSVPAGTNNLSINCSVVPSGGGYDIQLSAHQPGANGGDLVVTGHVDANGGTVNTEWVSQAEGLSYSQSDCKLSYTYFTQPIPMAQRISDGNIWAHVSCQKAMDTGGSTSGTQMQGLDGGIINSVCDGEADFLFSNCGG
jgi:hypothetical protein